MANNDDQVNGICSELWHAIAGPLVRLPPENSIVLYFPQGHAENANYPPEKLAGKCHHVVRCRLARIRLSAYSDTDEVFAAMSLVPISSEEQEQEQEKEEEEEQEGFEDNNNGVLCCSKVLTQSDANNGGGFSVPKICADRIFPALDYEVDPPVQMIKPRDVYGNKWEFRHIFRGTPRRHLLTTGWSVFVNNKSLVAGDCIVFTKKASAEDIRVGVRRGRKRIHRRIRADEVASAVDLAGAGKAFEVKYEPNWGEEFVIREDVVVKAAEIASGDYFFPGLKLKMEFEDPVDPTLTNPSFGTLSSIHPLHPNFFPNSPWKMLKVEWDTESGKEKQKSVVSEVNLWSVSIEPNMVTFPNFITSSQLPLPLAIIDNDHTKNNTEPSRESSPDSNNNTSQFSSAIVPYSPVDEKKESTNDVEEEEEELIGDNEEPKYIKIFGVLFPKQPVSISITVQVDVAESPDIADVAPSSGDADMAPIPDGPAAKFDRPVQPLSSYRIHKRGRKVFKSGGLSIYDVNRRKKKRSRDRLNIVLPSTKEG